MPNNEDYNQELDRALENYEAAAKSEVFYLLATKYTLSDYEVQCGISPARSFSPAVILSQQYKPTRISLSAYEWYSFISIITQQIIDFFQSPDDLMHPTFPCEEYCTVTPIVYDDCKFIIVKKHGVEYYMDEEEVKQIVELNISVISPRMQLLENLNFCEYYYVLDFCKNTADSLNPLQILYAFCSIIPDGMTNNALREFIYFYKIKVINDLNK
ncbi:uncharacterized protein LOC126886517 [Diabrotica virgifera virgifera]|uniref:Uncharacterized protein n=1 Tax=Diabrotica virgifera virgifera TaxID=50390 RepID=A0ABM5KGZ0_DIAVI|nr:uncharacterized protein LOC126886517 [Diabrotica virgifera virgifera]